MTAGSSTVLPCIWVRAGVLSYRLCDRDYQCERCELFRALHDDPRPWRRPAAGDEHEVQRYVARMLAGCTIDLDRWYGSSHVWVEELGDGQLCLGVDDLARRVLHPVAEWLLPDVGTTLHVGEVGLWARRSGLTVPLASPAGGTVTAVSPGRAAGGAGPAVTLADVPTGWSADGRLMRGEDALRWFVDQIGVLRQRITEACESLEPADVGPCLADGGEPDTDVGRVLGAAGLAALVREVFPVQI
jgi:hypothetical protein